MGSVITSAYTGTFWAVHAGWTLWIGLFWRLPGGDPFGPALPALLVITLIRKLAGSLGERPRPAAAAAAPHRRPVRPRG